MMCMLLLGVHIWNGNGNGREISSIENQKKVIICDVVPGPWSIKG